MMLIDATNTWTVRVMRASVAHYVWHIRQAGKMRSDRRFRSALSRTNVNHYPTMCGGAASDRDVDRTTAKHLIECAKNTQLAHWTDRMCPTCSALFSA